MIMHKRASSHLLIILQLFFVGLCCYPVGWRNTGSVWFLLLCLSGAALGAVVLYYNRIGNFSVYPEVRAGARLVFDGPYGFVRHPMYSALILMMIGIAGYNGRLANIAAALGVIIVVTIKALREEKLMMAAFPEYSRYASPLKRFVPWVI